MSRRSLDHARGAAHQLLARLRVTHPDQLALEDLAWILGARIVRGELPGAHARLARLGDLAVIRVSTRIRQAGAERFTIAHELGHLALAHPTPPVLALCGTTPASDGDREAEADAFAAELLMPAALVGPRCAASSVSLATIDRLAADFRVSRLAAAIRFVELTPAACALVYLLAHRVRWVVRSASFRPTIARDRPLATTARAFALLAEDADASATIAAANGQVAIAVDRASRAAPVRASAWFDRDALARESLEHLTLVEEPFRIPDSTAVASLLWIPPDLFT